MAWCMTAAWLPQRGKAEGGVNDRWQRSDDVLRFI